MGYENNNAKYMNNNYGNSKSNNFRAPEKSIYDVDIEKIFNKKVIETNDYTDFIAEAEKFAKGVEINSNQLRNFYDEITGDKLNEENYKKILPFLKVKLAYSKGRKTIEELFYNNFIKIIDETLKSKDNIVIFKQFFEAIVAYNKFNGDNKNGR